MGPDAQSIRGHRSSGLRRNGLAQRQERVQMNLPRREDVIGKGLFTPRKSLRREAAGKEFMPEPDLVSRDNVVFAILRNLVKAPGACETSDLAAVDRVGLSWDIPGSAQDIEAHLAAPVVRGEEIAEIRRSLPITGESRRVWCKPRRKDLMQGRHGSAKPEDQKRTH